MTLESEVEALIADEILGMIKNPIYKTNVKTFCEENHIDRRKLTSKKIFSMKDSTMYRIMQGISQLVPEKDFIDYVTRIAYITYTVAVMEDGSPEAIKRSHAGSPIGRKRDKK